MHPDRRRAGRRIRKQRRQFRNIGQTFEQLGRAAGMAAANMGTFFVAVREAVRREEEAARRATEDSHDRH